MAGIAVGDPAAVAAVGVPAGAVVGAAAEELVDVAGRLWSYRRARVEQFAATVVDEAGVPLEDLLHQVAGNPRALELLARTVEAASQAVDEWKVDVLAAVWANSLSDDATVDAGVLIVDALRQLEVPHLRLLRYLDGIQLGVGSQFRSRRNPDREVLPLGHIARSNPGLRGALDALAGKLVSLGMASWEPNVPRDNASDQYLPDPDGLAVTPFGSQCAAYLARRSESAETGTQ